MSENNAKKVKGSFDIDMEEVKLAFRSYDFEKVKTIQIFILSNTLQNPYLLVMFGVLKLFVEMIIKEYPKLKSEIYINFLLIHEIGKHVDEISFFESVKDHYKYFIPPDVKNEDHKKGYISSIIDLRFNEFMTFANRIMLNLEDETGRLLLKEDALLKIRYDDIHDLNDKIEGDDKDIDKFMETIKNTNNVRKPESKLLNDLLLKKVDKKDEIIKCLLRIFCHELREGKPNDHKKDAIFFIIDRWFKYMIEDYMKDTSSRSSPLFGEIHKRLICPKGDPPEPEKINLYLNPLSEYIVAETELNEEYFSSLLSMLSCRLFDEPFDGFYDKVIIDYISYDVDRRSQKTEGVPGNWDERISDYEEKKQIEYQRLLNITITKGFLTVQDDILTQLRYIS